MKDKELTNSAIEAIYWWNRTECYYHRYFTKLPEIYANENWLDFFTSKIFSAFLSDYSVRRNINSGRESVDIFLSEIVELGFFDKVIAGDLECIDITSAKLLKSGKSVSKNTISLLSKFAFLINPHSFSLYDTLAREALWKLTPKESRGRKNQLSQYTNFIKLADQLIDKNEEKLEMQSRTLKLFKGTKAEEYFSENPKAFNRRIVDKYFWIFQQKQSKDQRTFDNSSYLDFVKM